MAIRIEPVVTRPDRLQVRFEHVGDCLTIGHWRRLWQSGLFFGVALIAWTVGEVFLARLLVNDPSFRNILLALAFSVSWGIICFATSRSFLQHDTLMLNADGAQFTRHVLFPVVRKKVPLVEIIGFDTAAPGPGGWFPESVQGIVMHTLSQPRVFGYASADESGPSCHSADLQFALGLSEQEQAWLKLKLNEHLAVLQNACAAVSADPWRQSFVGPDRIGQNLMEELTLASSRLRPLSSFRWVRADDSDAIEFRRAGRLDVGRLTGSLILAAFVNSVVWCIILTLLSPDVVLPNGVIDFVGGLLICIPLAFLGALLIFGSVLELVEPFHTIVWRFTPKAIESQRTRFHIGAIRRHAVDRLSKLELRQPELFNPRNPWHLLSATLDLSAMEFSNPKLAFVGQDGVDICVIDSLTEPEARWMAEAVLRERRAWSVTETVNDPARPSAETGI